MKKIWLNIIDESFRRAPKNYIVQSLLAIVALWVILHFVGFLSRGAIVAGLGASTFIVFVMPNASSAQPRRLIGGHIVGMLCGLLCYYACLTGPIGGLSQEWISVAHLGAAISVGLSIFVMTITNTEHPPAAGTALGIVAHEWTFETLVFIVVFPVGLAVARYLLRHFLKDLR